MLLLQHRPGCCTFHQGLRCCRLFVVTVVVSDGIVVTVVFILRTSMPEAERSIGEFWPASVRYRPHDHQRIRRVSRGVSR